MIPYRDLLRCRFRWGGEDPATGLDCWSLARLVCARAGRALPTGPELAARGDADMRAAAGARAAVAPLLALVGTAWSDAVEGDVIEYEPFLPELPPHVAPVVSVKPPLVLHLTARSVCAAVPPWRPGRVLRVWRAPAAA